MTLKELELGDKFVHLKGRECDKKTFTVYGNNRHKRGYGMVRDCLGPNFEHVSKSSKLEVIKVGENKYKKQIIKKFSGIIVPRKKQTEFSF